MRVGVSLMMVVAMLVASYVQYTTKGHKELAEGGQLGEHERALYEERLQLVHALGWAHWEDLLRAARHVLYPRAYPPF